MTFGGHIANIAREGVWASLTGGWYYEPANSLFCNTIHLYIWALLFILPILLGLCLNGSENVHDYAYAVGYLTLVGILFVTIKICVAYLHHVFDTVQPIKYKSKKCSDTLQEQSQHCAQRTRFSGSSISATRATESNAMDMIEMLEMDPNLHPQNQPDAQLERREADANYTAEGSETKMVENNEKRSNGRIGCDLSTLKQRRKRRRAVYYHSLPSFGPTKVATNFTDGIDYVGERNASESSRSSPSDLCSSSDGLPKLTNKSCISKRNGRRSAGIEFAHTADSFELIPKRLTPSRQLNKLRKYSQPINTNKAEVTAIKHKTASTTDSHESLGQHCHSERRKNEKLDEKQDAKRTDEMTFDVGIEPQEPCCSSSLFVSPNVVSDLQNQAKVEESASKNGLFWPESIQEKSMDFVVQYANMSEAEDLKGQITKFLEELIEKHPEAMDAIESVRMNRLMQLAANKLTYKNDRPTEDGKACSHHRQRPTEENEATSSSQQRYLAIDSTDTNPGAVHAFQDEHGNWLTYWFGSTNFGTAQPLMQVPTLLNMSNCESLKRHEVLEGGASTQLGGVHSKPLPQNEKDSNGSPKGSQPRELNRTEDGQIGNEKKRKLADESSDNIQLYKEQPTVVNVIDTSSNRDIEKGQTRSQLSTSSSSTSFSSIDHQRESDKKLAAEDSSSSDEASRYITPINLLRASAMHGFGATTEADELPNLKISVSHGTQISSDSSSHLTMQRHCHLTSAGQLESSPRTVTHSSRIRSERLPVVAASNIIERLEGADQPYPTSVYPTSVGSPFRLLNDLQMGRPLPSGVLFYHSVRDALTSRSRQKYCYRLMLPAWLNWWPFGREKGTANCSESAKRQFILKLDRLSLLTIFDKNSSAISLGFDIILALFVGLMAVLLLCRRVYTEMALFFFAFTVAGAQFSLLKSVQPDSASPVHGFNWLIAYSRPIYFVFLSSIVLFLDWTTLSDQFSLDWHPFWLRLYANVPFHLSLNDFCVDFLLFLPLIFTFGLLPQVNTLCMHLLEQFDMHFFGATASNLDFPYYSGATASLSLISSIFSVCRSAFSVILLTGAITIVQRFSQHNVVGSVGFSAFVSLTNAIAYLLSRESSGPQFVKLLLDAFWRCVTTANTSTPKIVAVHVTPKEKQQQFHSSQSSLNDPSPSKQLLNCCILTNIVDDSVTRRNSPPAPKQKEKPTKSEEEKEAEAKRTQAEGEGQTASELSSVQQTLVLRTQHNLFSALLRILLGFGIHRTLLFQNGQPLFQLLLALSSVLISLFNHNIYSQMRAKNPWKLFARPILRSHEYCQFEPTKEAKLTVFEKVHIWMVSIEKNVLYPLLNISLMSTAGLAWNNGHLAPLALTICSFRLARTAYAQPNLLHFPLLVTFLIHRDKFGLIEDAPSASFFSTPLFSLFVTTIVWSKLSEFLLKAHFILCYIAPWQISWGSAFHAFAQPFSIPHSGLTLAQTLLSSILSAPLNPFLGSSFFLMSYVRPVKFWERDYNTNRIDHSKLRLASQLDRSPMIDDSNLNAIFYEHLTRSLQISLAGDLLLGRWACTVQPGDCFILSSNYLNCMVLLVECGNGFVTFQLRGLEFRGTYCHQREMEAISEDWAEIGAAFSCCFPGNPSLFLSFLLNNAWALRWLAWEVTVAKYVVDGYSISDNSAVNMLQIHELRRLLVTLYVKCMIFYAIDSPQLSVWLADETILTALGTIRRNSRFVDLDPVFCAANDEDFDINIGGLSRQSFTQLYAGWIEHCLKKRTVPLQLDTESESSQNPDQSVSLITSFCFALSMLGRRALGTAAYNRHSSAAESFLFGMDALFKGDMRIAHPADEWVFADLDILNRIISPAIRMALKLHQDHFAAMVDLDESAELFDLIEDYRKRLFISHEHDPEWRRAILGNKPSLLALRHICDDGQKGDYKIIMLNKRHLDMRVIKLNRECVRAFWAGQQQELVFLRNKNPERGSIQNARQVLRNIINSSADQPIGYPIYVSPLTTSFVETHNQLADVLGPPLTLSWCARFCRSLFGRIRANFGPSASSIVNSSQLHQQSDPSPSIPPTTQTHSQLHVIAVDPTDSAHQKE